MKKKSADLKARQTFGFLTVLRYAGKRGHNDYYDCRCQCGNEAPYQKWNLLSGNSQSCGCLKGRLISLGRTVHGHARPRRTREYGAWKHAKGRCYTPTDEKYPDYGGRGIRMAEEWLNDFQAFFDHIGPAPPNTTLDRIHNDGHYQPGNVRWATAEEQANNQRRVVLFEWAGRRLSLSQIARIYGIHSGNLWGMVHDAKMQVHVAVAHILQNRERTRLGLKKVQLSRPK
ncbi:MAG TPA: hypothetical protein VLH80_07460 [Nitrospiraceae bacterium]|nr:hypothetical protein [Nitrospiraceae bacterium]